MPHLTLTQWILAIVASVGLGVAKAGFTGVSLLHVLVFAFLFGARDSTGIVLPMLIVGDIFAVRAFHQHVRWAYVWRMLPPACVGIILAAAGMSRISDAMFKPLIGWIIIALTILQIIRMRWPGWFGDVPHSRAFAWATGLLAGGTTMLANSAAPVMALYALAVSLPKFEYVGTTAWFFLFINLFKVPFSVGLGLIHRDTILLNLLLVPAVLVGLLGGQWLIHRVPQQLFDGLLLAFAGVAALRLVGLL